MRWPIQRMAAAQRAVAAQRIAAVQRGVAGLVVVALLGHWVYSDDPSSEREPHEIVRQAPNVVLIVADDLGYAELGCYGQQRIQTPHLDRLAREGIRFTQAYAGNAVCAPSRSVLLSGQHPGHALIRDNKERQPEGQWPLPAGSLTLTRVLQQGGYVTGVFGKWGLGGPQSTGAPLAQGVQRFFGYNCQRHAHSYFPSYLWSDNERVALRNMPPVPGHAQLGAQDDQQDRQAYQAFVGSDYAPDAIHQQAKDFLHQHRAQRFFLFYPSPLPHLALQIPPDRMEFYRQQGWHDPPYTGRKGSGYTPQPTPRAAYAAMITQLDHYVGDLLQTLEALGLSQNTLVIFSSDNGTTHVRDQVDTAFFQSVGPLRGLKGSLYEGGIRVPLIVRWPGTIAAGVTSHRVVGFEDILPTLAQVTASEQHLAGAPLDGIDFSPTLYGKAQPERPFLYREFAGYGGQQAVRWGDWKVVRQNLQAGAIHTELYNLAEDLGESTDVAPRYPALVQQGERWLVQEHQPSPTFPLQAIDTP